MPALSLLHFILHHLPFYNARVNQTKRITEHRHWVCNLFFQKNLHTISFFFLLHFLLLTNLQQTIKSEDLNKSVGHTFMSSHAHYCAHCFSFVLLKFLLTALGKHLLDSLLLLLVLCLHNIVTASTMKADMVLINTEYVYITWQQYWWPWAYVWSSIWWFGSNFLLQNLSLATCTWLITFNTFWYKTHL